MSLELLGRRIHGRPGGAEVVLRSVVELREGDPEVAQVRVSDLVEHDVRGLHVTVHDSTGVSEHERGADLIDELCELVEGERALAQEALFGRSAAQVAHHEERAARFAPVIVQRDDVGMFEARDELRLGLEPAMKRGSSANSGFTTLIATSRPTDGWVPR